MTADQNIQYVRTILEQKLTAYREALIEKWWDEGLATVTLLSSADYILVAQSIFSSLAGMVFDTASGNYSVTPLSPGLSGWMLFQDGYLVRPVNHFVTETIHPVTMAFPRDRARTIVQRITGELPPAA